MRLSWTIQRDREIHYREWFERMIAEGYAIGGKDPAASFLTNIRDSPAVQRGSAEDRYRLDPHSRELIAQRISETCAELADLDQLIERAYVDPDQRQPIETLRGHRDRLRQSLKSLEAKMHELNYIFEQDETNSDLDASTGETLRAA